MNRELQTVEVIADPTLDLSSVFQEIEKLEIETSAALGFTHCCNELI